MNGQTAAVPKDWQALQGGACINAPMKVTRETDRLMDLADSLSSLTSRLLARVSDLAGMVVIPENGSSNKVPGPANEPGLLERQNNSIGYNLMVLRQIAEKLEEL